MSDEQIRQCEHCREWRHKSAFVAGRRFCLAPECQRAEGLTLIDAARRAAGQRQIAVAAHLSELLDELKPDAISGIGWRILQLRSRGLAPEDVARELDMKVRRVNHEETKAMHQLHAIAKERIGVQA